MPLNQAIQFPTDTTGVVVVSLKVVVRVPVVQVHVPCVAGIIVVLRG